MPASPPTARRSPRRTVVTDADGTEHVRLNRYSDGLPVLGGDLGVHPRQGRLLARRDPPPRQRSAARPKAALSEAAAGKIAYAASTAADRFGRRRAARLRRRRHRDHPRLRDGRRRPPRRRHPERAARLSPTPPPARCSTQWEGVHRGHRQHHYSGTVTLAATSVRQQLPADRPGRGGNKHVRPQRRHLRHRHACSPTPTTCGATARRPTAQTAAVDAAYGAAQTWDYYKNVLGRNGIAQRRRGRVLAASHYGNNYVNAFWSDACFCMTYGDGDAATRTR